MIYQHFSVSRSVNRTFLFYSQLQDLLENDKAAIIYFAKQQKALMCFELLLFKWDIVVKILTVLKLPFEATNGAQKADFTLSDFFGCWLSMKRKLTKLMEEGDTALCHFAQTLSEKLDSRGSILLNNMAMISAIYLDPRYKFKLSPEEVQIAKNSLEDLWKRIKIAREIQPELDVPEEEDSFEDECVSAGIPRAYYDDRAKPSTGTFVNEILINAFERYDQTDRLHRKHSLMAFWNERRDEEPVLYDLACIIHSIPPTQATVERAFSTLGFIYSAKRTRLKPSLLENILLIRLNRDLVEPINRRDVEALKNEH